VKIKNYPGRQYRQQLSLNIVFRVHPPLQQQSTVQTINSKITVHVKPVGDAPQLQKEYTRYKVNPAFTVAQLHKELRRRLGIAPADSLYLFVHAAFAPSLDNTASLHLTCIHLINNTGILTFRLGIFKNVSAQTKGFYIFNIVSRQPGVDR
jgi:hypothetical protein